MNGHRVPEMDAQHQLLDRQILDTDGRMVGKVDDIELEEQADGRLAVIAVLTGPGALGPRLGGALGALTTRGWSRLTGNPPSGSNRISFGLVARVGTVLQLSVRSTTVAVDGFEEWVRTRIIDALPGAGAGPDLSRIGVTSEDPDQRYRAIRDPAERSDVGSTRHRLNELLGMRVRFADGTHGDQVTDVRLVPGDRVVGHLSQLVTEGLVIGKRRPGTLLGYDRNPTMGPWIIRMILRYLHRDTGYLEWRDVDHIDWSEATVHATTRSLRDLQPRAEGER